MNDDILLFGLDWVDWHRRWSCLRFGTWIIVVPVDLSALV
jgi:hypothetical protein